jgi:hypothetical protein
MPINQALPNAGVAAASPHSRAACRLRQPSLPTELVSEIQVNDTTSSITYKHGNVNDYFSTSSFALPALGTFGNTGLNTVRLPGLNSTQFSVAKKATFYVASEHAVTTAFQAQFFNLFNHSSFNGVGTTYGAVTFGKITAALEPRNIAFRLKFSF